MVRRVVAGLMIVGSLSVMPSNVKIVDPIYFDNHECHIYHGQGERLGHDGSQFFIELNSKQHFIQPANVDKAIRSMNRNTLLAMLGRTNADKTIYLLSKDEVEALTISEDAPVIKLDEKQSTELTCLMKNRLCAPYFSVVRADDGEYVVHLKGRLLGGGPIGAATGGYAGYVLVYGIGYGLIGGITAAATAMGGPCSGGAVGALLIKFGGPVIHAVALTTGLASGIAGAVITGPA